MAALRFTRTFTEAELARGARKLAGDPESGVALKLIKVREKDGIRRVQERLVYEENGAEIPPTQARKMVLTKVERRPEFVPCRWVKPVPVPVTLPKSLGEQIQQEVDEALWGPTPKLVL